MPNLAATKFLKQVIAAFCRFPIPDATKELYAEKLSKWTLTADQWNGALEILIESHEEEGLPQLVEIYRCLKAAISKPTVDLSALADMYFTSGGYDRIIQGLVNKDGKWVYPPGHKYAGMTPVLPPDSTRMVTVPYKQAPPEETYSRAEVGAIVAKATRALRKMA